MESLVRFTLRQKVFFNLAFVVLTVAGAIAMLGLPAERYPNVSFGEVIISTFYPSASPSEVETLVTREIEEALESVKDIEWIQATSYRERSHIKLKFVEDRDYDTLFNEVRFKVLNILDELPAEIDPPEINNLMVEDFMPVIAINLAGDHSNRALTLMAEELKTSLARLPGIREIKLSGEFEREFHVKMNLAKMKAFGVSFDQSVEALQNANVSIPAGDFRNSSGEFVVKVDEKFRNREQVLATIIRRDADASFVRIRDIVSSAGLGYRDPPVISSVNGEHAVALQIIKADNGNALDIKQNVMEVIDSFRPVAERENVNIVITQDTTDYIKDGINTLGMNMLVGILLVSIIIWYFMGVRNAGLITIGIPFSFMMTMLIMYLSGNSLNELTLFSFVLVTGIIVDDAIIVTENIYRHVQEGKNLSDAIIVGVSEVALPVISATMTTVAAFMPMLIMSGSTGEFFALIPKAVSFAVTASLIECLLILPIHYLDFGPNSNRGGATVARLENENMLMQGLRGITKKVLAVTLKNRLTSVSIVMGSFVIAMLIFGLSVSGKAPLIRIKFFPDDYTLYYVDVIAPSSTPIEVVDEKIGAIAQFIIADGPGMAKSAAGFAGFFVDEDYQEVYGNNHGLVLVSLPPTDEQTFGDSLVHLDTMRDRLKKRFEKNGFKLRIHPQREGPPSGKDINVRVVGGDPTAIANLSDELLEYIQKNPKLGRNLVELDDNRGEPKRVFRFRVKHNAAREYGLDSNRVAELAASVLDGRYIGRFRLNDEEVDLKAYIESDFMKEPEDALFVPLVEHASGPVRLDDLTWVEAYSEPGDLNRFQGQRASTITANIKPGAPMSTPVVVNAIKKYFRSVRDSYPGVSITFGGEHEDTQRSYESLAYAFIVAVLLMYVILATQFQSYLQPLIILSAIVFALIGVIFGKLLTQSLFTVNSFIAVIGVAGVVVNDSLVLIDFINKRYRAGMSRRRAIEEGVRIRLRPIVLTTLTTTLGLLPMAIGIPSYSEVWGTMASTFVTGLATATALTLFVVPVIWDLLQGYQERRAQRVTFKPGEKKPLD